MSKSLHHSVRLVVGFLKTDGAGCDKTLKSKVIDFQLQDKLGGSENREEKIVRSSRQLFTMFLRLKMWMEENKRFEFPHKQSEFRIGYMLIVFEKKRLCNIGKIVQEMLCCMRAFFREY